MVDRFVSRALTLVVIGLISLTSGAAITCAYHGLMALFAGHVAAGGLRVAICPAFGVAATWLIRNREDLMDR